MKTMRTKTKEYELVPTGSLETLEGSLRAMERKLQLTMVGWALSVVVLGVLGVIALGVLHDALHPSDLRARSIRVIDTAGRTRLDMGTGPDGPAVTLYDAGGKMRLELLVTADGPKVVLADSLEAERTALEVNSSGMPDFTLTDSGGYQAILTPSTVVFDKDKKVFWTSPLPPATAK
jgi:hypothetical protein